MSRWLYLLVLIPLHWATPAHAEMTFPIRVTRYDGGWVKLEYPPPFVKSGQVLPLQLCLRAVKGILHVQGLNVLPEGGREDKTEMYAVQIGFFPFADGEMPPYVTYRV